MQSEVELDDGPPPGLESITPQPPPGFESISPQPPPLKESVSPQPPPSSEMAQMVCGSCRRLLKYPRGARHVQCSCCQTFNFVLEAHQVGQVECGNCAVLLMYPFGATAVRCSSCNFVTEVGEHNKRPPWSAQQGQRQPPLAPNPVC